MPLLGAVVATAWLLGGPRAQAQTALTGSQFQVNSYTTFSQLSPAVATDPDGDFVVVWQSDGSGGSDTSDFSIQGQRGKLRLLFGDGFESGDTTAWSAAAP
jgi:hypothetical protein